MDDRVSASSNAQHPPSVRSAEELQAVVAALPSTDAELVVRLEHVDLLRHLTLLGPEVTVMRLDVTVSNWQRPHRNWHGRPGRVPHLLSCSMEYPEEGEDRLPGDAHVDIRLEEPTPLGDVARGAFPMLAVNRALHGYGLVEVGTAGAPAAALAFLPTRAALGAPRHPSHHLKGLGLSRVDLGLVAAVPSRAEIYADPDDPEVALYNQPLVVDSSGHLATHDRLELPILDLNVHNPIDRLHTFDDAPGALALTLDGGQLSFSPQGPQTQPYDGWTRPATEALSGAEATRLSAFEMIDLGGLRAEGGPTEELTLYRRLAELAATGVILHSMPAAFTAADDVLGPVLANLLRLPYRTTTGLLRELRTVPQRREAMLRFGGFYELASHSETMGHRLLPSVSVVLSSMRPARAAEVITALGRQTYPHLEIAVALHGVDEPVGPEFEAAVRETGALVGRHDRGTPFGSVLAETARRTTGDLVVKIDDDDFYGPRVIEDLVLAYVYSNADVVGKTTEYLYFEDIDVTVHRRFQTERYHYQVAGGAMMLSRAALNEIGGWRPSPSSTDRSILIRLGNIGGVGYRTQSLGYVYVRHLDGHTWKQADSMLLRKAPEQWPRFLHEIVEA